MHERLQTLVRDILDGIIACETAILNRELSFTDYRYRYIAQSVAPQKSPRNMRKNSIM